MTNAGDDAAPDKDRGAWWVFGAGAFGAVVLAIAYLRFRTGFLVGTLEAHAQLGDALGPVVAFLTLLAVVSALWSVQIQRVELALQRKELQETRDEMVEQRQQFKRTAEAQEALAKSQGRLADAQEEANRLALVAAVGQQRQIVASLVIAETQINAQIADLNARSGNMGTALRQQLAPALAKLAKMKKSHKDASKALSGVSSHWKDDEDE